MVNSSRSTNNVNCGRKGSKSENEEHCLLDYSTFPPERAEFAAALIVEYASGVWPRIG
jgi:hypothetical protein